MLKYIYEKTGSGCAGAEPLLAGTRTRVALGLQLATWFTGLTGLCLHISVLQNNLFNCDSGIFCFRSVQRVTLADRTAIDSLLEELEDLSVLIPLTPSPESKNPPPGSESGQQAARGLFSDSDEKQDKEEEQLMAGVGQTPTKLFDASATELT